jgi:NAD(P)-dependent dehydrogenase (short-subunit alcohol dehydrogenase family)
VPRRALVTGAGGGIGRALAARLARDGFAVVATDRIAPSRELNGWPVVPDVCDLADAEDVRRLAAEVGDCDVIVNCAADLSRGRFDAIDAAMWRRVQAVNVDAPLLLCQGLVPGMLQRGWGRIVNVVSDTVHRPPGPEMLAYVTSKAAMIGFTRALAVEVGARGVTVNALAPGLSATEAAVHDLGEGAFAAVRRQQALDRTLVPADLEAALAFIVSDGAAALTGQTLCLDGGLVML